MIDYILHFDSEASAKSRLSSLGFVQGSAWDLSRVIPGITAMRGGEQQDGFWVQVSTPSFLTELRDISSDRCKAVFERSFGAAGERYLLYSTSEYRPQSGEAITTSPVFAGAAYGKLPPRVPPDIARGVNISGAEFGTVPGVLGTDYTYPLTSGFDYHLGKGVNCFRIPFRWERVQHDQMGELDIVGNGTGDWERLLSVASYITSNNAIAILDCHNYMRRMVGDTNTLVGSDGVPAAALVNLWERIAAACSDDPLIWLNLMNEPNGISAADNRAIQQQAVTAIRATGATNKILVSGASWSGAHSWVSSGNAEAWADFSDANAAFDVHQYLDSDNSGTHAACGANSANRLNKFIDWCKEAPGRYGFLGEFGAGPPSAQPQCGTDLPALIEILEDSGVFIGWSAWGAGPWWSEDYIFRLDPIDGQDTEFMQMLLPYLSGD